jgi:hypothetical protein
LEDDEAFTPLASSNPSIVWSTKLYLANEPFAATLKPKRAMSSCSPESSNSGTAPLAIFAPVTALPVMSSVLIVVLAII